MWLIGKFITLIFRIIADLGTDNIGSCFNFNGEAIRCSMPKSKTNWSEAWKICDSCNSSLPIIRNRDEQEALFQFLNNRSMTGLVWTAGKKANKSNWTWINGQPLENQEMRTGNYGSNRTATVLSQELKYEAEDPLQNVSYICQFKSNDTICSENITENIMLKNGCVDLASVNQSTWYEARNECLERGGNLTVLDDSDLDKLNQSSLWQDNTTMWLELRKNSWTWYSNETDSLDDLTYTNWNTSYDIDPLGCIAMQANDGKWRPVNCTDNMHIVCEKRGPNATSLTTCSPEIVTTVKKSEKTGSSIYAWSGSAVVIGVICIIIVVIIASRYHRKSSKRKSGNQEPLGELEETLQTAKEERTPAQQLGDCINGVYAEIPLVTISSTEDVRNAHPGIVYASLDFGNTARNSNQAPANETYPQGDLYAEVNKPKSADRPVQWKIGPLGDIYTLVNYSATRNS